MIENDDFFEKGYKTLTKNLPAAPIEKVEVLKRYSNNKLLKGIEESDKIALNLTLSDEAKRQWFANISLAYDVTTQERYDATGDISNLVRSSSYGEPGSIGDNQQSNKLILLSDRVPYFKESRFKFNNAELL